MRTSVWAAILLVALSTPTPRPASAGDDVPGLRAALSKEDDPARRAGLVARLGALGGPSAAKALAGIARSDDDAGVRALAGRALGRIDADDALDHLLGLVEHGGPRAAREAFARALVRRTGGSTGLKKSVEAPRAFEEERVLAVLALGAFRDETSRSVLLSQLSSESPAMREAAARALARRKDARLEILQALLRFLDAARDRESMLLAMDAVEPAVDVTMRPVLVRMAKSPEPCVVEAAEHLLDVLRRAEAAPAGPAPGAPAPAPANRYAPPEDPDEDAPSPPTGTRAPLPRPRHDLVYAIDVTGSVSTTIEMLRRRIADELSLLGRLGGSVRVGVIAFRGGHGAEARNTMDVLLPSFDLERVARFLGDLRTGGVDGRGTAVGSALSTALDRMPWRWDARREVRLIADGPCDDPALAAATVGIHFRADLTRTTVAYVLRTRSTVPSEYAEISRFGGGALTEVIR